MSSSFTQIPFAFPVRRAFGREDFLVAPSNDMAVKFIDAWPNWSMPALTMFGPESSGKSHLAAVWQEQTQAVEVNIDHFSSVDFSNDPHHIVIDKFDRKIDPANEVTFFHLYNIAQEHHKNILFLSERSPMQIQFTLPDLSSRMRACPTVEIFPPDDTLLSGLLIKLFADYQLPVTPKVIDFLVSQMERSFAAAIELVDTISQKSGAEKRAVTLSLVRDALKL